MQIIISNDNLIIMITTNLKEIERISESAGSRSFRFSWTYH